MKNIALLREFYRFLGFSSRMLLHLTHNGTVNFIAETLLESLNEGNISTRQIKPSNRTLICGRIERDGSLSRALFLTLSSRLLHSLLFFRAHTFFTRNPKRAIWIDGG